MSSVIKHSTVSRFSHQSDCALSSKGNRNIFLHLWIYFKSFWLSGILFQIHNFRAWHDILLRRLIRSTFQSLVQNLRKRWAQRSMKRVSSAFKLGIRKVGKRYQAPLSNPNSVKFWFASKLVLLSERTSMSDTTTSKGTPWAWFEFYIFIQRKEESAKRVYR